MLAVHFVRLENERAHGIVSRDSLPAAAMAQRFDALWQAKTGTPLRIVGGDDYTAAMIGLMSGGRPSLFADLDPARAPAMTDDRLQREGALVLWTQGAAWTPSADLLQRYPSGREFFVTPAVPKAPAMEIDYLLIAPGQWRR